MTPPHYNFIRSTFSLHRTIPPVCRVPQQSWVICRHSSTNLQRRKLADVQRFQNPTQAYNDRVNPPASTRPSPLDIAKRRPDQGWASYAWKSGKSYLGFYRAGIKNIWGNYKAARELRTRLKLVARRQTSEKPSGSVLRVSITPTVSVPMGSLTRAEFQLLKRNSFDTRRIPIFGLLFLIFGEWLPVVVIFFTRLVPYTCRIPKQIEQSRRKAEERRQISFRGILKGAEAPAPRHVAVTAPSIVEEIKGLKRSELLHISRSLGLHGRFWDRLSPSGETLGLRLPPTAVLMYKVKKHLHYLEQDDHLMKRDGKASDLVDEEVRIACEERGVDVLQQKTSGLREVLQSWQNGGQKNSTLNMLLSRPSVWAKLFRT